MELVDRTIGSIALIVAMVVLVSGGLTLDAALPIQPSEAGEGWPTVAWASVQVLLGLTVAAAGVALVRGSTAAVRTWSCAAFAGVLTLGAWSLLSSIPGEVPAQQRTYLVLGLGAAATAVAVVAAAFAGRD